MSRLDAGAPLPEWVLEAPFFAIARTPEELSILCPGTFVPSHIQQESGWRCLQVQGPLDFTLTGVLASLLDPLARAGISIFALSTYNTDYILVKSHDLNHALDVLRQAGHIIIAQS